MEIQHHNDEKQKLKIDIQSFLQTIALLLTIIAYAFHQNDRLTILEAQQRTLTDTQKELTSTQKIMVDIFNTHLISVAGDLTEFRILKERIHEIEIRLKLRQQLMERNK